MSSRSLPNEYIGVPSRWAIHVDNIRLRWEPLAMRWEGKECASDGRVGGDTGKRCGMQ